MGEDGRMEQKEWLQKLILSSIPLRQLGADLNPVRVASGCLVDYGGKRILLTVAHATGNMCNWAIEVEFDKSKGKTLCYQLGRMHFLKSVALEAREIKVEDVDFSYVEVPSHVVPRYQRISRQGDIRVDRPREILEPDFSLEPSKDKTYGFSGQVMSKCIGSYLLSLPVIYPDLTFEGADGDYTVFRLPMDHPGHEYFKGCSGAPILDSDGNVVALVCFGVVRENAIYGISLREYRTALDILIGNVG